MLVLTFTLCLLLISTSCQANIYERLSDANPCLSKYGVNEGYGEKQERIVNTIHIVSQNVRVRENKIYYDLGFDGEVSLENAVMRFTFHYTLPNGMDKTSSATLTSSSQDEDYVCHFEFTGNTTIQYNITLQLDQSTIVATAENTVIDWSNLITRFEGDTVAYPTLTFTYLDLNYQTETYTVTDSAASITVPMIHSYAQLNVSVDYPDAVITSIDNNANARWSGLDRPSDSLESGHININSRPAVTSGYPSVCNLSFTPNGIIADKTLMPISVEIDFDAVVIGGFTATNSQIIYNHDWYAMTLTPTITHSPSDIGSYTLVLNESEFDDIFYDFSIESLARNLYFFPSQDPFDWYDNQISSYTHNIVDNAIVLNYFFDISPEDKYDSSPIDVTHVYTNGIADYNYIRGSVYTGAISDSGKNYPVITERYGYNVSYSFNMIPVVNRVNIASQTMRYDVFNGATSADKAKIFIEYTLVFDDNVMGSSVSPNINGHNAVMAPASVATTTFIYRTTVELDEQIATAPEQVVINNANDLKQSFEAWGESEGKLINWSNLKTSWTSEELVQIIHIVSERAYVARIGMERVFEVFVELVFDRPVLLPSNTVEFNLSGFNSTGISNGQQIFNVITFNGNSVKLRRNRSFNSGSMGFIGNGVVNYVDGEYIVGDNNYMINWGDDYLTRNIFDNSRIYSQGE